MTDTKTVTTRSPSYTTPKDLAIGAQGYAAQTEQDLGHWLLTQGRKDDATPLLTHARAVYKEIGALGWLTRLDSALDRDGAPS